MGSSNHIQIQRANLREGKTMINNNKVFTIPKLKSKYFQSSQTYICHQQIKSFNVSIREQKEKNPYSIKDHVAFPVVNVVKDIYNSIDSENTTDCYCGFATLQQFAWKWYQDNMHNDEEDWMFNLYWCLFISMQGVTSNKQEWQPSQMIPPNNAMIDNLLFLEEMTIYECVLQVIVTRKFMHKEDKKKWHDYIGKSITQSWEIDTMSTNVWKDVDQLNVFLNQYATEVRRKHKHDDEMRMIE